MCSLTSSVQWLTTGIRLSVATMSPSRFEQITCESQLMTLATMQINILCRVLANVRDMHFRKYLAYYQIF